MNFYEGADVWEYLASCGKPAVMYGMGNGADKILSVMEQRGIAVGDFFASDGFVRGHSFHGKPVLSFADIREKYDDFVIVLSFASALPELLSRFAALDRDFDLVAPDVPVSGATLFDRRYFDENRDLLEETARLLADDESRRIFETVIKYKLSGRVKYLFDAESDADEIKTLLHPEVFSSYMDLGAYNGDTVRAQRLQSPGLKTVYAMEPDARSFKKLSAYCETVPDIRFSLLQAGAWDRAEERVFESDGSRNSGVATNGIPTGKKTRETVVSMQTPDALANGERIDYIKYDVEGSEARALDGSRAIIEQSHPALCVSAYHKTEDLIDLSRRILSLDGSYRLYLRRFPYVPAWDLNLYCI